MNVHPAATLFPLMDDDALKALADDIAKHGLRDPIETINGDLLDGRNRLRACELAGVTPSYVEVALNGESPIEYVVSRNLHRRHLTTAQRAALAVELLPHLEAEARERQIASLKQGNEQPVSPETDERGRSDEKAADMLGVGRTTVAYAKAINNRAPDVIDRMRSGEIKSVAAAAREAGFEGMAQNGRGGGRVGGTEDAAGRLQPQIVYGKGDKFDEAIEPLRRYLAAWARRDFEFTHVNPKEARRRLLVLDRLSDSVERTRLDLESRSESARLTL